MCRQKDRSKQNGSCVMHFFREIDCLQICHHSNASTWFDRFFCKQKQNKLQSWMNLGSFSWEAVATELNFNWYFWLQNKYPSYIHISDHLRTYIWLIITLVDKDKGSSISKFYSQLQLFFSKIIVNLYAFMRFCFVTEN